MPIELLFAYRFLRGSRAEKNISFMIKICFLSIFIGICALTLVAFIMSGFEKATYKKLQSIHSDLIIRSNNRAINFDKLKLILESEFKDSISAFSPSSVGQVIIQNKDKNSVLQTAIILKAIDPATESEVSNLKSMLITQKKHVTKLSEILIENHILIGKKLAENLRIKLNNQVTILFPTDLGSPKSINFDSKESVISGFFNTGIDEFDEHVIFCALPFFNDLFDTGITEINIKLKDLSKEAEIIKALKKRFSLDVVSWKDLYPALVSSLILEKYVMIIIFLLMALVASINSIALLFMFITHKQADIALLKALGISENKLARIFMSIAGIITISGGIAGLITAILIGKILQYYPIALPSAYYVDYIPVNISLYIILIILITIIFISIITLILPVQKIKNIPVIFTLKKNKS